MKTDSRGQGRSQEPHKEAFAGNQVRDGDGLDQGGDKGGNEEWMRPDN